MKRRLLVIAIFLLLGAVVNVAVAWGHAASVDGMPAASSQFENGASPLVYPRWSIVVSRRLGSTIVAFNAEPLKKPDTPSPDATAEELRAWAIERYMYEMGPWPTNMSRLDQHVQPPYWSRASVPPSRDVTNRYNFLEDARGFPMRRSRKR